MSVALHFAWFVILIVILDFVTRRITPGWVIAAMAIAYVAILYLDREKLMEAWVWVKTQANKFSSPR